MTITQPKVRAAVDGDFEIELLRRRYHQLRGYRDTAEREMDEIKEKLQIRADEIGVEQFTVGGEAIVSICRFDRLNVKAHEIKRLYPRIFRMFGSTTPVVRVDIR